MSIFPPLTYKTWEDFNHWASKAFKWVVVIKVWNRSWIASSNWFWRDGSNSAKTSSNNNKGGSLITSSINCNSANFKAKTNVLCCPWEPYCRAGVWLIINSTSSRWGPTKVIPRCNSANALCWSLAKKAVCNSCGDVFSRGTLGA